MVKKVRAFTLFLLLSNMLSHDALPGDLLVKGTVTCIEEGDYAARPAQFILVYPEINIRNAELTKDSGLYELVMPGSIVGNYIELFYKNSKKLLFTDRVGIWDEDVSKYKGGFSYEIDTVELMEPCQTVEENYATMHEVLTDMKTMYDEELNALLEKDKSSILYASGGLGFLSALALGAAGGGAADSDRKLIGTTTLDVIEVTGKEHKDGKILSYSMHIYTSNMGFNYSAGRNTTEAVFWNPAAMSFSNKSSFSFKSNFDDHYSVNLNLLLKNNVGLGIGYLGLLQNSNRDTLLSNMETVSDEYETNEHALFYSMSYLLNDEYHEKVALGATIKLISQDIDVVPETALLNEYDDGSTEIGFNKNSTKNKFYDLDMSLVFDFSKRITMGLSVLDVLNKKLRTEDGTAINTRTLGLGATFKNKSIQYGIDVTHSGEDGTSYALGINKKVTNNFITNAGYDSLYSAKTIGFKYRILSYIYTENDELDRKHLFRLVLEF